jgi:hypothetical protein
METVDLCKRVIDSFDTNTQLVIGALITIALNTLLVVRQLYEARKTREQVSQLQTDSK